MVLPASGQQTIARLTLEAEVPAQGCRMVELSYLDGLKGSGQPVKNVVTVDGNSFTPARSGSTVLVCAPIPKFEFSAVPEGIASSSTPEGDLAGTGQRSGRGRLVGGPGRLVLPLASRRGAGALAK